MSRREVSLFMLDDADIAERVSRWRHGSVGFKPDGFVGKGFERCAWTFSKASDDEIISCRVYFGAGEVERCAEKVSRYVEGSR